MRGHGWGRRGRRAGAVAAAIGVVVGLAGCTRGPEREVRSAGLVNPPAQEAWRLPITPVGQVLDADGVAVLFTTSPDLSMTMTAIDPAKGKVLWTAPASAGLVGPGSETEPALVTGAGGATLVTWLQRERPGEHLSRIVVADPRTGRIVARSAAQVFTEQPSGCDTGGGACAAYRDADDEPAGILQLAIPGADDADEDGEDDARATAQDSGDGFALVRHPRPALTRDDGTSPRWTVPVDRLFGTAMLEGGARVWHADATRHVFYLTMTRALAPGRHDAKDLYVTVAVAVAADGRVLWRRPGTVVNCFAMHVVVTEGEHRVLAPVLCSYQGPITVTKDSDGGGGDVDVSVEGFDRATGRVTWAWQVGRTRDLWPHAQWDRAPAVLGPTRFMVGSGARARELNVVTGTAQPARAGTVAVCRSRRQFEYIEQYWYGDGRESRVREGGILASFCDTAGRPVREPVPGLETLAAVGTEIDDTVVLSTPFSVVGYR